MLLKHPDGGHCYLEGMTDNCYGCICYGGGLIAECEEHVKRLREYYQNKTTEEN